MRFVKSPAKYFNAFSFSDINVGKRYPKYFNDNKK